MKMKRRNIPRLPADFRFLFVLERKPRFSNFPFHPFPPNGNRGDVAIYLLILKDIPASLVILVWAARLHTSDTRPPFPFSALFAIRFELSTFNFLTLTGVYRPGNTFPANGCFSGLNGSDRRSNGPWLSQAASKRRLATNRCDPISESEALKLP